MTKRSFVLGRYYGERFPGNRDRSFGLSDEGPPHRSLKIDEARGQDEGGAVFYLLAPHNAFMTADIGDKGSRNWAESPLGSAVLIGNWIKQTILESRELNSNSDSSTEI
jgi:hypothetical protein